MPRRQRGRPPRRQLLARLQRFHYQRVRTLLTERRPPKHRQLRPPSSEELKILTEALRQQDARGRALDLRASKRSYSQIARDPILIRILGRVVSRVRIKQILTAPPAMKGWIEDVGEAKRRWCIHLQTDKDELDREFWNDVVFPLLLVRSGFDEPDWALRHGALEEDEARLAADIESAYRWKLRLRDGILCHLFFKIVPPPAISESSKPVVELARKFSLSARRVCRILLDARMRTR